LETVSNGVASILYHYRGSLSQAIKTIYSQHAIDIVDGVHVMDGEELFQKERALFESIGMRLGVVNLDDWYRVKPSEVRRFGIELFHYGWSLVRALEKIYPEHRWYFWNFEHISIPQHYWNKETMRDYLIWIAERFHLIRMSDWHRLSNRHIYGIRGGSSFLLKAGGGLFTCLSRFFPSSSAVSSVAAVVRPKKTDGFSPPNQSRATILSCSKDQLLLLTFEFQGIEHYTFQPLFRSLPERQKRDQEKREACSKAGITLIEIPYWWKGDRDSLFATLKKVRPDIAVHWGTINANALLSTGQQPSTAILERPPMKVSRANNDSKGISKLILSDSWYNR